MMGGNMMGPGMMEKTTANDESNGAAVSMQTSGDTIDHKSHH